MLYKGYWIDFVALCPAYDPDGGYNPLFVVRKRHAEEILAEAHSIGQALDVVRSLEAKASALDRINERKGAA